VKMLLGFIGLLVGALVSLFGLFLIAYTGDCVDCEGDIYVNLWARRIDSDFIGVPLLIVGLIIVAGSLLALRRRASG
jgi:ABC-type antimicrobial peptide transport system permease subunit